jgi:hypothetical protein
MRTLYTYRWLGGEEIRGNIDIKTSTSRFLKQVLKPGDASSVFQSG